MNNRDYWKKRFIAIENQNTEKTIKYFENLEKQFKQANKKIEAELSTWYRRFAVNNNITLPEAKRLLNSNELKELKWDVNDYIKHGKENAINQKWLKELENASSKKHITRLEALKLQLQQQVEVLYGNQLDDFDKLSRDVYHDNYYHTAFEIQKGFNVGYDLQGYNERQLEKVLNGTWGADGSNFSNRIWKHKAELLNTLNNEITLNIIKGKSPDDAIKNIAKQFNVSKNKAGRLVMTESAYISSLAQKDCYKELDVERYEIVATLDSHTSHICQDLDGEVFKMSEYESGVTAPPFHPYCRSCTCPYFDDDYGERIARDENGEKYFVPSNMKYHDWYKKFVNHDKKIDLQLLNKDDVLKVANNIKNWKKYANEIKSKYDIEIDTSVFDLNLDTVKSSFIGVEKMIKEYPEIKQYIKVLGVTDKYVMSSSFEGALLFNKTLYSNSVDDLIEFCNQASNQKLLIPNCTPEAMGVHEGTHFLERHLIEINKSYSNKRTAWNDYLESKDIVLTACYNVKKKSLNYLTDEKLRSSISIYASDNYSDSLAESFADVFANSNNAKELSKEVKKLTLERLKRGKL